MQHVYGSSKQFPIFSTEFGYQTTPPDTEAGTVSPALAAEYLNWSEYLTWRDPRIRSYDQYLLVDPPRGNFASALEFSDGTPKPGFYAYRMPIYLPVTATNRGQPLEVWGAVRPAYYVRRRHACPPARPDSISAGLRWAVSDGEDGAPDQPLRLLGRAAEVSVQRARPAQLVISPRAHDLQPDGQGHAALASDRGPGGTAVVTLKAARGTRFAATSTRPGLLARYALHFTSCHPISTTLRRHRGRCCARRTVRPVRAHAGRRVDEPDRDDPGRQPVAGEPRRHAAAISPARREQRAGGGVLVSGDQESRFTQGAVRVQRHRPERLPGGQLGTVRRNHPGREAGWDHG